MLTGLSNLKIFKIRAKNVLKVNWSVKTPWHERMEVAQSGLWAPGLLCTPTTLAYSAGAEKKERAGGGEGLHTLPSKISRETLTKDQSILPLVISGRKIY